MQGGCQESPRGLFIATLILKVLVYAGIVVWSLIAFFLYGQDVAITVFLGWHCFVGFLAHACAEPTLNRNAKSLSQRLVLVLLWPVLIW